MCVVQNVYVYAVMTGTRYILSSRGISEVWLPHFQQEERKTGVLGMPRFKLQQRSSLDINTFSAKCGHFKFGTDDWFRPGDAFFLQ